MKKSLKIIFLILFKLSCIFACWSQGLERNKTSKEEFNRLKNIQILRDSIAQVNEVHSRVIGGGAILSKQFARYERLLKIANEYDLLKLSMDSNGAVATYASYGLIKLKSNHLPEILEHFLTNQKRIDTRFGCKRGGGFVYTKVYYKYRNDLFFNGPKNGISKDSKLLIMDSLMLELGALDWYVYEDIFSNRRFPQSYLPLIERLAFQDKNVYALNYIFEIDSKDKKEQVKQALIGILEGEILAPVYYEKIFDMLLSFKEPELNSIVFKQIKKIDIHFKADKSKMFDKVLAKYKLDEK